MFKEGAESSTSHNGRVEGPQPAQLSTSHSILPRQPAMSCSGAVWFYPLMALDAVVKSLTPSIDFDSRVQTAQRSCPALGS
jgi:hypothetical protein